MIIGCHMPGGLQLLGSIKVAEIHEYPIIQAFLANPRKLIEPDFDVGAVRKALEQTEIKLIIHAPYIINVAGDDIKRRKQTMGILRRLMESCDAIGASYFVAHTGSGSIEGAYLVAKYICVTKHYETKFCLENDPGSKGGTRVGSLSNLIRLRKRLPTLGICVDTAHAYGAGHHVDTDEGMELIKRVKPDLIHLNEPDDNVVKGRHLDRHNTLFSEGTKIGLDKLTKLAVWAEQRKIPCIVEADLAVAVTSIDEVGLYLARI